MDIAFHIGANCTDEDRLLKSLLKNNDSFSHNGIKVPGPGKYRRLIRETIQSLKGAPPEPGTSTVLLDAILDDVTPNRLILSNANFICIANRIFDQGVFYQQTEAKIKALIALFPEHNIEFHMGIRNPATFLPAAFKNSKAATFDAYLKGFHPTHIRWSDVIRRIRYAAPDSRLTVWCNEDTPLIWPELVRTLAGISPEAEVMGGYDLLSSIMSTEGMKRFLDYLGSHPPKSAAQERKIIMAFLDKYALDDAIEEEVDLPGMTDEVIFELSELYERDVSLISEMEDVRLISPW